MALKLQDHALTFVILFALLGAAASLVQVSKLWGTSGQYFTLFDFFSALPAAFLGPLMGLAAVFIAKGFTLLTNPNTSFDALTLARALLPPAAGALFFWAYKNKQTSALNWLGLQIIVPAICILLFISNSAIWGTAAMVFAGYWLIPIAAAFLPNHLFARSLGATFSQHAVGGVLWLYLVPSAANPAFWLALIPVVAVERLVFAGGISLSYLAVNALASRIEWISNSTQIRLAPAPLSPEREARLGQKAKFQKR